MLVYRRASSEQDLVLKHELDEIAERSGARVVDPVRLSTDAANGMSARALNRIVGDLSDHDVYLCASPRLATTWKLHGEAADAPRRFAPPSAARGAIQVFDGPVRSTPAAAPSPPIPAVRQPNQSEDALGDLHPGATCRGRCAASQS